MSVAQEIASHIPHLRRFTRALVGSQDVGDALVSATLEAIVARGAGALQENDGLRANLYRELLEVWRSRPTKEAAVIASEDERGAQRRLGAMPPGPRIALLLNALERFDLADVAAVMGVTQQEAGRLIEEAGRDISRQMSTDALIIEDEPFIALDLQKLVEQLGHRVVAVARTLEEAVQASLRHPPGLILADIQLADGSSGLDAVNLILQSVESPVIFITAYPERFLTGRSPEPAFLITKPFSVDSLKAVISQALFFDRRSHVKDSGSPTRRP